MTFQATKSILFTLVWLIGHNSVAQEQRFHGEFGLFVGKSDNNLEVRWFTQTDDEGYLEASFRGEPHFKAVTNKSRFHLVNIPYQEDGEYFIQYGSKNNEEDLHTTRLVVKEEMPRDDFQFSKADSVFIIGDTHGYFDNLRKLLQNNGLVDENLKWKAGRSRLVLLGDLMDRGPDVTRNLWWIYQLEKEAHEAGGRIHILLGNHEVMVFSNDLRYIHAKEKTLALSYGMNYRDMFDLEKTIIGQWLASKPAIIKIGDLLFSHGGLISNYGNYSIKVFNDSTYAFMNEPEFKRAGENPLDTVSFERERIEEISDFFYTSWSPFWYRGYVKSDTLSAYVDFVLKKYKASVHVMGHTVVPTITKFYDGKIIATDLPDKATEMLLLVRKRKRYDMFKFDIEGKRSKL